MMASRNIYRNLFSSLAGTVRNDTCISLDKAEGVHYAGFPHSDASGIFARASITLIIS